MSTHTKQPRKNKPTMEQAQVAAATRMSEGAPETQAQAEAQVDAKDAAATVKPKRKGNGAFVPTLAWMRPLVDAHRVRTRLAELDKAGTGRAKAREQAYADLRTLARLGLGESEAAAKIKAKLTKWEKRAGTAEAAFLRALLGTKA